MLGLCILRINNVSCPCCPWRNPKLSRVNITVGWQDTISMLSLAFPCWRETLGAGLSLLGNGFYMEILFVVLPVVNSPVCAFL